MRGAGTAHKGGVSMIMHADNRYHTLLSQDRTFMACCMMMVLSVFFTAGQSRA